MNIFGNTVDERILHVGEISADFRHKIIHQLVQHLDEGQSLQLVVDHDPHRLRVEVEVGYAQGFEWSYLERGPDVWRVRILAVPSR